MAEAKETLQEKLEEMLKSYGVEYIIPILETESLNATNIKYLEPNLLLKYFTSKPVGEYCNFCRALDEFKRHCNVSNLCYSSTSKL